jgi:cytochrome c-type biogenesis protein
VGGLSFSQYSLEIPGFIRHHKGMHLSGNILDYFLAFGQGVLVSFTPCVYPLIPITAGFIAGVNTHGSRLMGFVISVIYVLGLALSYCALAAIAAYTGKFFGKIQNNPFIFLIVANIFIFFALVMLDVISLPALGIDVRDKVRPRNLWAVFLFGATSGLIVGPCTSPFLAGLLTMVSLKQNVFYGVSLLFVFSYGVGFLLILVGTFSGVMSVLPKSGPWLLRIKQLSALILIIAAQYFLIKAGRLWF